MKLKIKLGECIEKMWKIEDQAQVQHHIHVPNVSGGSNLNPCVTLGALKKAKVKGMPVKTGYIRNHKGGLRTGTWLHEKLQNTANRYFEKYSAQYPDLHFIDEIYAPVCLTDMTNNEVLELLRIKIGAEHIDYFLGNTHFILSGKKMKMLGITRENAEKWVWDQMQTNPSFTLKHPDYKILNPCLIEIPHTFEDILLQHPEWLAAINIEIVYSPIDYASLTDPGVVFKPMRFANFIYLKPFKHPDAEFIQIWDIKSAGNYGYWMAKEFEIREDYQAQFEGYIKGAELPCLTLLDIHKAKAYMFEKDYEKDPEVWLKVLEKRQRVNRLSVIYRDNDYNYIVEHEASLAESDLSCLEGGIKWYSCPLAKTHEEEIGEKKELRLVLDELCPFAQRILEEKARKKFKIGQKWKRGSSHITILGIYEKTIESQNKGGKKYMDSLVHAFNSFVPMG